MNHAGSSRYMLAVCAAHERGVSGVAVAAIPGSAGMQPVLYTY